MSNSSIPTESELRVPYFLELSNNCRMDSYEVVDRTINIEEQINVAKYTYEKLQDLHGKYWSGNIPITEQNFIRMWKTLILVRVQEVYDHIQNIKADSSDVNFNKMLVVPAPLWDLLNALGQFKSNATGVTYNIVPPKCPDILPDWWTVDYKISYDWVRTMNKMSKVYKIYDFPLGHDFQNRSIMLTTVHLDKFAEPNSTKTVRSLTNECTALDSFLRWIHDDFIESSFPFQFNIDLTGLTLKDFNYFVYGPLDNVVHNVKLYVSSYVLKK